MLNIWPRTIYIIIGLSLFLRLLFLSLPDLLVEEAYYWNYAQHLDFGYLDHPPMVALLIKATTSVLGTNELGVRISAFICWLLMAFFSIKLTQYIAPQKGLLALMLACILPFYFIQSIFITPDAPLMMCWAASLYYLYRALILEKITAWYWAGFWIGLGMLSKYTIVLLGLTTLTYICFCPPSRFWLKRKEPYLGALITLLLFSPVIYWNALHHWISFLFQTKRRVDAPFHFSVHLLLGELLLFLTPLGVIGLWQLIRTKEKFHCSANTSAGLRFVQIYTLTPLIFFGLFSISHEVKFNWIGPCLLAIVPWLAIHMNETALTSINKIYVGWIRTAIILFFAYTLVVFCVIFGQPNMIYQHIFNKFIHWEDLTKQFHQIATRISEHSHPPPAFAPLDAYNIGSELLFYQAKLLEKHQISFTYPVLGRHIFGGESLMYRYWSTPQQEMLSGHTLILIADRPKPFQFPDIKQHLIDKTTPTSQIWAHTQGINLNAIPYYYQVTQVK